MSSDDVGMILDKDFNIAVRTGYHCAPYIHKYLKDKDYNGKIPHIQHQRECLNFIMILLCYIDRGMNMKMNLILIRLRVFRLH